MLGSVSVSPGIWYQSSLMGGCSFTQWLLTVRLANKNKSVTFKVCDEYKVCVRQTCYKRFQRCWTFWCHFGRISVFKSNSDQVGIKQTPINGSETERTGPWLEHSYIQSESMTLIWRGGLSSLHASVAWLHCVWPKCWNVFLHFVRSMC